MTDVTLYHWEPNANSGKPMLALEEKGVAWSSRYVNMLKFDQHQPEYLAINPQGTIPAITHGELVLTESTAIMEYVDSAFDGPALMPSDPQDRWRVRWWMKFMDQWLGPSFSMLGWSAFVGPKVRELPREELDAAIDRIPLPERRRAWSKAINGDFSEEELAESGRRVDLGIALLEKDLGRRPYVACDTYSLADINIFNSTYALPLTRKDLVSHETTPNIMAWLRRVYRSTGGPAHLGDGLNRTCPSLSADDGGVCLMTDRILYHGVPNGPSLSALAALAESGLEIECRPIDLLRGARHALPGVAESQALEFAVEGEGPVLVCDGEAMSEAVFLAQYFDEAAEGCGLQPADPYARWQMLMWCRQADERLAPAVAYLGNLAHSQTVLAAMDHAEFGGILASIESADLRERWQDLRDGRVDAAKVEDSKTKVAQFAERVENQLADSRAWLMGDFSIADLETFAWLHPMRELEAAAFAGRENCNAWMDRVEARPSVQAALARAATDHPERSFAPGPEINRWG